MIRLLCFLVPLAALGSGCAITSPEADRVLGLVTPYRIDVTQGNVVTKELAAQVKPGMSREQVRDVLGSPLLTSAFHADRWDYVFTFRRQGVPSSSAVSWPISRAMCSIAWMRLTCRPRTSSLLRSALRACAAASLCWRSPKSSAARCRRR
jgi:SmpA / OmlA family